MLNSLWGRFLAGVFCLFALAFANAQEAAYREIANAPKLAAGVIEVQEFFAYDCPHCRDFDPMLEQWRTRQAKDVSFVRMPVSYGDPAAAERTRLYLSLNALGLAEKFAPQIFKAVQDERIRLHVPKTRDEWLTKQGLDVARINTAWRSFSVEAQLKRIDALTETYRIMAVPSLVINGKYVVEGGSADSLKTADMLIARIRAGR